MSWLLCDPITGENLLHLSGTKIAKLWTGTCLWIGTLEIEYSLIILSISQVNCNLFFVYILFLSRYKVKCELQVTDIHVCS